jgi:plasmid stabilization system protein ParE
MRVRYTPESFADRERIFEYLRERSPSGVRNVMANIREAVRLLSDQPYSGYRRSVRRSERRGTWAVYKPTKMAARLIAMRLFRRRWPRVRQYGILADMTAKILKDVLERVETWPQEAQEELAAIALEMDAGLGGGVYHATPEELAAIDEADFIGVATKEEIEAAFAKFRGA